MKILKAIAFGMSIAWNIMATLAPIMPTPVAAKKMDAPMTAITPANTARPIITGGAARAAPNVASAGAKKYTPAPIAIKTIPSAANCSVLSKEKAVAMSPKPAAAKKTPTPSCIMGTAKA